MLASVFKDKRLVSAMFLIWTFAVVCMFAYMGVLHSSFVRFGPSEHLNFLNFRINTWARWALVAAFYVTDSFAFELAHEAIHPWEINSVLDPKARVLPYRRLTCLWVLEAYYLHGIVISPFTFWLHLTQLDFILIKGTVVVATRTYSHYQYIKDKEEPAAP